MNFCSFGLQRKWGFYDGDVLSDIVSENFPEVAERASFEMENDLPYKECRALYFEDNLLEIIVLKYMLPEIPHEIIIQRWGNHNPVRAKFIDGERVDFRLDPPKVTLLPEAIEVKDEVVLEEAKKLWDDINYLYRIREQFFKCLD